METSISSTPCNPVRKELISERLQPETKQYYDEFSVCPGCNRVYWKGSRAVHSSRLLPRESSDRGCATLFVAPRITITKAIHTSLGGRRPMSQKTFSLITSVIFLLIAAGHVLRLAFGWKVTIAGQLIPTWVSWTAFVIAIYLASEGLRLARKPK
jgi:hypothetical protein